MTHPAWHEFLAVLPNSLVWGQVVMRRAGDGFELRHVADADAEESRLRKVRVPELRALAQFTAEKAFRPLKSAPNLARGWGCHAPSASELARAIDHLYPGSVVDWFAARRGTATTTACEAFTARQTGMYRITAQLTELEAARLTRVCCGKAFCLKQRRWTAGALGPDDPASKSAIPCLEPCALWLEFARTVARLLQDDQWKREAEGSTVEGEDATEAPREADFGHPANPRRLGWLADKAGERAA